MVDLGVVDARPAELGEPFGLDRAAVGEGQGVAGSAVERFLKVDHVHIVAVVQLEGRADLGFPVEGCLEGVFDAAGAAFDEEVVLEVGGDAGALDEADLQICLSDSFGFNCERGGGIRAASSFAVTRWRAASYPICRSLKPSIVHAISRLAQLLLCPLSIARRR